MFRTALALVLVLGSAATAQAQSASSPIRAGTYDLEIAFGGGVLEGTLVVTRTGDSLDAVIRVGDHESPVHPTRREGTHLVLQSGPGLQVQYDLDFKGDEVTGTFTYEGQTGSLKGKRRGS